MTPIDITSVRREELQLIKNCKEWYLILLDYIENKKGNIRDACRANNRLVNSVLMVLELHGHNTSVCDKDNAEGFGAWQQDERFEGFGKELLKPVSYVPGKVKSIRRKLKAGLKNIHSTIETLLMDIHVEGSFARYAMWGHSLELFDPEEEKRRRQEAEAKYREEKRIRQLLNGPACSEKVACLEKYAEKKTYIDKNGQVALYYKYEYRLYDLDGTRFGYAEIVKRGIKDEM